ncbi:hypothetical protein [Natrarchaeobaculum sulfurireducens]|uniref:Uncharacterized protein n=1 Tax=Natrarchaeobaculum sulfurireducens TaxID=2044521 RepID=A0A346PTY2_9EURY|nr:hypothetical protein [Natrarchaeobaculum sulfurireducens]AXR77057.1 hypothetical protein AArc1_0714 [Natrarchaeobaculum sulfurireducens]AXR82977.1 hypothetical protein AArcMg_2989 [Natrarchaeobaculum sulfurireducens]
MDEDTEPTLSVDEFVEYCRIQAGLLSGQVERMGEEADELLAEVDERVGEIRKRLEEGRTAATEGPPTAEQPPGVDAGNDADVDVAELEELQSDLEEKQLLVEAKQARMEAFQKLAAGYADLATDLSEDVDDGTTALERIVDFEIDHDAPAYFPDRQTLVEALAEADDEDD